MPKSSSYSVILCRTHEGEFENPYSSECFFVSGSEINYFTDKDKLYELYNRLERNPYINKGTLDFWYIKFQNWLNEEGEYLRITAYYVADYRNCGNSVTCSFKWQFWNTGNMFSPFIARKEIYVSYLWVSHFMSYWQNVDMTAVFQSWGPTYQPWFTKHRVTKLRCMEKEMEIHEPRQEWKPLNEDYACVQLSD